MDILVFSDSHGHGERIEEILQRPAVAPSAVFFLGDGLRDIAWIDFGGIPVYSVSGNCDIFASDDIKEELLVELGGVKIFAAHGHRYSVKSGHSAFAARAAALGADIALFGHTHTAMTYTYETGERLGNIELNKPLYLLNSGSIGEWDASFGSITIQNGHILTSFRYLYK